MSITCVKSAWRNDINFHFYISYEKNSMYRVKDVAGSLRSSTVIIKPDYVKSNCFRKCGYRNGESSPAETMLSIAKIARLHGTSKCRNRLTQLVWTYCWQLVLQCVLAIREWFSWLRICDCDGIRTSCRTNGRSARDLRRHDAYTTSLLAVCHSKACMLRRCLRIYCFA